MVWNPIPSVPNQDRIEDNRNSSRTQRIGEFEKKSLEFTFKEKHYLRTLIKEERKPKKNYK